MTVTFFVVDAILEQYSVHTESSLVPRERRTPLTIGLALLGPAVLGVVISRRTTALAARLGSSRLLAVVGVAFAAALVAVAPSVAHPATVIIAVTVGLAAFGISQALLIAQVAAAAPPALRGVATGLLQLTHVTGGAIGSATGGALAANLSLPCALAILAALPLLAGLIAWTTRTRTPRA